MRWKKGTKLNVHHHLAWYTDVEYNILLNDKLMRSLMADYPAIQRESSDWLLTCHAN